mgnify:CR=1 FL=1
MLKKSFATVIGLAAAVSFLFSACDRKKLNIQSTTYVDDERDGAKIILGFSQIGTESSWRTENTRSVFEAAAEQGIQVLYDDAQQKQTNQLKAIRSFIVYRVDVIAFVPIVEDGWDNVLREAKEARIPVIVVDRKIKTQDESLYAGFIGEDGIEEGRKAARFLLQKYSDSTKKLNVLELRGTDYSSMAKERSAGFREVLLQDPRFCIVKSVSGDFLRSRGKEIISNIFAKEGSLSWENSSLDIIFSHNDAMSLGALDTLQLYGEKDAVAALREGKINCIVECNPRLGPELIKLVKTAANRNTIPRVTYVDGRVYSENDDFSLTQAVGF